MTQLSSRMGRATSFIQNLPNLSPKLVLSDHKRQVTLWGPAVRSGGITAWSPFYAVPHVARAPRIQ